MEQSFLNKIFATLRVAYPYYFKDLSKEESIAFTSLYSKKLSKYEPGVLVKAIDEIITTSKFMPSLSEIIDKCTELERKYYSKKLGQMYEAGYFKNDGEYGKALQWLFEDKPIIPVWLKNDIKKFENKDIKLIGKEK